ncbi:lysophospholipid acyltransferase family protein [Lutibacter sp. TH_r2]|uniref:lysophospholipid acyltransferase family protein n=1 Tax=Lutibacter sp. TH_r2 TaxID=3082083 RepID=UPI002955917E|nr:lysophospholipid acyltransferase family protein [Lutibacter sp. TH_r2]MDV7186776.1 lysophospholipid acyltransferase family protein [Lutibacter sp. TH_r2]
MKKFLAYIPSAIYQLSFAVLLLIFHPIQWLCLKIGGYKAHKKSVDALNFFIVYSLYFLGTKISFKNNHRIPENVPLIIVSNHQSMNDIPAIIWFLRKYHPKFVAKKELGKGIPSISFNLKHGGSVLIDRKDAKQAITEIAKLGKYIEANNRSAVIFPEGTRSRNGVPKRFSPNGLKMLVKYAPSAYVLPITVNNSWKFLKYGGFPNELGVNLTFDVHEPIKADSMKFDELFESVEASIKSKVVV